MSQREGDIIIFTSVKSRNKVLVYRTKSGRWEGPFSFISVGGETAVIQHQRGRKIFRSICVRPYTGALGYYGEDEQVDDMSNQAGRAKNDTSDKKTTPEYRRGDVVADGVTTQAQVARVMKADETTVLIM